MPAQFNPYSILSLVGSIFSFTLLAILARNGIRRDYEKAFALGITGIIALSFMVFGAQLVVPPDELDDNGYNYSPDTSYFYYPIALLLERLILPAAGGTVMAFLYFSLIFPRPLVPTGVLRAVRYAMVLAVLTILPLAVFTGLLVPEAIVYWAGYRLPFEAPASLLIGAYGVILFLNILGYLKSYFGVEGIEKNQLRFILWGGGTSIVLLLLTSILPSVLHLFGVLTLPVGVPEGTIYVIPFEAGILYAILKYRLFDPQLVIRNGLINGIAAGLAGSVVGAGVVVPYYIYRVEAQVLLAIAVALFLFLFVIQNSLKSISTRMVERFIPNLKWRECRPREIYLVHYPSGHRLVHIAPMKRTHHDPDIVSGMLAVVTGFVKESFHARDRDTMRSLVVGDMKLMIEHSSNAFLVIVFTGFESSELRTDCRNVLRNIERRYGGTLRGWDGEVSRLAGLKQVVAELMPS